MKIRIIICLFIALCTPKMQAQDFFLIEQKKDTANNICIEIFSDFPSEISGCSCFFSKSYEDLKSDRYIFINDFAALAFVKIEGEIIRFELQNYDEIKNIYHYTHGKDIMKVEVIKKETNEDMEVVMQGIITINTAKGYVKQEFIGQCGC